MAMRSQYAFLGAGGRIPSEREKDTRILWRGGFGLANSLFSEEMRQAVEAEAEAFLALMADWKLADGRAGFVRHGHGPERTIQIGIGAVPVQRAKIRDRGTDGAGDRIRLTSAILPRWGRRSPSLDALLPVLYLRGVSSGDFQEALSALLGPDAPNLSPSVIGRLKGEWEAEYLDWQERDFSGRRYVYAWADSVYLQARMEPQVECMLVIIGAMPDGKNELFGFQVGFRKSTQNWKELLVDLEAKGLTIAPELATGDGALGFWKALEEVFPKTRHQRRTVHKTGMSSTMCPNPSSPRSSMICARSGLHPTGSRPKRRSTSLPRNTGRNTTRPSSAWSRIEIGCSPSSISLPSTGIM
jgi:hypothetical protein